MLCVRSKKSKHKASLEHFAFARSRGCFGRVRGLFIFELEEPACEQEKGRD